MSKVGKFVNKHFPPAQGKPAELTKDLIVGRIDSLTPTRNASVAFILLTAKEDSDKAMGYVAVQLGLLNLLAKREVYDDEARLCIAAVMKHDKDFAESDRALHHKLNVAIIQTLFPDILKTFKDLEFKDGLKGSSRQLVNVFKRLVLVLFGQIQL